HTEVTFPEASIIVLFDNNGKGKTSIQEGILWGLSGEINRFESATRKSEYGSIDALYNLDSSKNSRLQVILEFTNKTTNLVCKINRPKRNKSYLTSAQKPDQRYYINDTLLDKTEFIYNIQEKLKLDPEDFQLTNFLSQEIINEALVIDENIRANVFSKILSFQWMQEINDVITQKIKDIQSRTKELKLKQLELNDKLRDTELNTIWRDLQESRLGILEQGIDLKDPSKISYDDYIIRLSKAFTIQNDTESLTKLNQVSSKQNLSITKFGKIKDKINTNNQKSLAELGKLRNISDNTKSSHKGLIGLIEKYKEGDASIANASKQVDMLHNELKIRTEKKNSILKINKPLSDLVSELKKQVVILDNIKGEELNLNKKYTDKIHLTKQTNDLKAQLEKININLDLLDQFKIEIQPISSEIQKLELKLKESKEGIDKLDHYTLSSIIEELEKFNKEIRLCQSEIPEQINFEDMEQTNKVLSQSEIITLPKELKTIEKNLIQIKGELTKIPIELKIKRIQEYIDYIANKDGIEKNIETFSELIDSYETKVNNKKAELDIELKYKNNLIEKKENILTQKNYNSSGKVLTSISALIFLALTFALNFPINMIFLVFALFFTFALIVLIQPSILIKDTVSLEKYRLFVSDSYSKTLFEKEVEKQDIIITSLNSEIEDINLKIKENDISRSNLLNKSTNKELTLESKIINNPEASIQAYRKVEEIIPHIELLVGELDNLAKKLKYQLDNENFTKNLNVKHSEFTNKIITLLKKISNITYEIKNSNQGIEILEKTQLEFKQGKTKIVEQIEELDRINKKYDELNSSKKNIEKELNTKYKIKIENITQYLKEQDVKYDNQKKVLNSLDLEITKNEQEYKSSKIKYDTLLNSTNTQIQNLDKFLQEMGLTTKILEKSIDEIKDIIGDTTRNNKQKVEEIEKQINEILVITQELDILRSYFDKLELIQDRWSKNKKLIETTENQLYDIKYQLEGIHEFENLLKDSYKGLQKATEKITNDTINNIKQSVKNHFLELGGHDSLEYLDLNIRYLRGKLKVEIVVGTNKSNSGAPKALFSNGEQVSLVLSLFFAVTSQLLENSKFKWIGLDEPTQYLDSDRKKNFIHFLNSYSDNNPSTQMLITTADAEFVH
ncbi:MAG: hypothetical protein OEZ01_10895, partial [Candidatus Heimdallarchaeota archaeon]|nr:hypothetical protein [Candidatus Heimdallarchaeota archaeon]